MRSALVVGALGILLVAQSCSCGSGVEADARVPEVRVPDEASPVQDVAAGMRERAETSAQRQAPEPEQPAVGELEREGESESVSEVEQESFAAPAVEPSNEDVPNGTAILLGEGVAQVGSGPVTEVSAPAAPDPNQSYRVRPGDTLSSIARSRYGDRNESRRIYQANRDQIESPDLIYPGQTLTLP